jgi:TM2 domain-containing membrane protein YozV
MTDDIPQPNPAGVPAGQKEQAIGTYAVQTAESAPGGYAPAPAPGKSFVVTWLFAWLLGGLGIDRFYLGKVGTGLLKLLTFGGFGVWWLVDLILVLTGAQRDKQGHTLVGYREHRKIALIITAAGILLSIITSSVNAANAGKSATTVSVGAPSAAPSASTAPAPVATETPTPVATMPPAPVETTAPVQETTAPAPAAPVAAAPAPAVPAAYKSALAKATSYSKTMHMSKAGIYDQLTSEYGEQFPPEAAQYAVDNVQADWNANALAKAKSYQDQMSMSPEAIRDQLSSAYGEKFTVDEAEYAIQHLSD